MSRIVIKIGSAVITDNGNGLDGDFIGEIAHQVNELIVAGHDVVIVSSGAVASDPKKNRSCNLRAMIGQGKLIGEYARQFAKFELEVAQLLVKDEDFLRIKNDCGLNQLEMNLLEGFEEKIVTVINFNDGTSDREMKMLPQCADNDVTAKNVCLLPGINFDYLIVLANVQGVMDEKGELIPLIDGNNYEEVVKNLKGGSRQGFSENGIKVKAESCRAVARTGRVAIVAPGHAEDCVLRAFNRLESKSWLDFGTFFI
ncbi:hypothetical protein KAU09_04180 [Candidatus Parcubacteria bacterium]|nr:hypothetical protein [Candidatus Parcubacteria bacterium]